MARQREQLRQTTPALGALPGLRIEVLCLGTSSREILLGREQLCIEVGGRQVLGNGDLVSLLKECNLLIDPLGTRLGVVPFAGELEGHRLPLGDAFTELLATLLQRRKLAGGLGRSLLAGRWEGRELRNRRRCAHDPRRASDERERDYGTCRQYHLGFRIRMSPSCATDASKAPSCE